MEEAYLAHGSLVPEKAWQDHIRKLRENCTESSDTYPELKRATRQALHNALDRRLAPQDAFGVLFSGGVDSTVIAFAAKQHKKRFRCITVGFQDTHFKQPEDVAWAQQVASRLELDLTVKVVNLAKAETLFATTAQMLGSYATVVNVGVGSVVVAALENEPEKHWFSGLGSEEIFAGYERHKQNPSNEECWNGLFQMWQRDLVRDTTLARQKDVHLHTPFLDTELVGQAMRVPIQAKLHKGSAKHLLRDIAQEWGIPRQFAFRKKRAAQYGSSLDRAMAKLTKKRGCGSKQAYLDALVRDGAKAF